MVFRHLFLAATHAEAGHFTSRTHALSHSRAPMLELTDWLCERSERVSPPPPLTLSPALLLSPAAVTIERPPHRRYKKNPVLSFLLLCSIFPLAAAGRSLRSHLSRGGRAYLSHRSSTWPHGTAVQQLTLIVVRTVELSPSSSPVVYSPATADQQ